MGSASPTCARLPCHRHARPTPRQLPWTAQQQLDERQFYTEPSTTGTTNVLTTISSPKSIVQWQFRLCTYRCSSSTGIPTAPAPLHFTFTFTRFYSLCGDRNTYCNHDRQPRFGSDSDSRHQRSTLERTPCTDMRQRRRAPSTTKRSPCCPDVTDTPRAPSREGHNSSQARPTAGAGTAQPIRIGTFPFRISSRTVVMAL